MVSNALAMLPDPGTYARFLRRLAEVCRTMPLTTTTASPFPEERWMGPVTLAELQRKARAALQRRINVRAGFSPYGSAWVGRRATSEYEWSARRDARAIIDFNLHRRGSFGGSGLETKEARVRCPRIQAELTARD